MSNVTVLTEEERQVWANRGQAVQWKKEQLVASAWDAMSAAERKIVLGLELSTEEYATLVTEWENR